MGVVEKRYWLEGIKEGEKRERERIIKLLEPLGCEANGIEHDCDNGLGYTTTKDLIKLINGEKLDELPNYHCPDCRDLSCAHCVCVDLGDCKSCEMFAKESGSKK
jgi:hypothetical protein